MNRGNEYLGHLNDQGNFRHQESVWNEEESTVKNDLGYFFVRFDRYFILRKIQQCYEKLPSVIIIDYTGGHENPLRIQRRPAQN